MFSGIKNHWVIIRYMGEPICIEKFSSKYVATKMFVEPHSSEKPQISKYTYSFLKDELGYSPILLRFDKKHYKLSQSGNIPTDTLLLPVSDIESDGQRVPDIRNLLIATDTGAYILENVLCFDDESNSNILR